MNAKWMNTTLGFMLAASATPLVARCEVYLSELQALQLIFPGEIFSAKTIVLSPEDTKKIELQAGQRVKNARIKTWISPLKNTVFVDQVIGKHDFITYAVGITQNGKIKSVEILEYRESYGQQIKTEAWRKQFEGKTRQSPLKVGDDINNISGATLSSTHVTDGIKRILQIYDSIRTRI